jgi:hypothetical protein
VKHVHITGFKTYANVMESFLNTTWIGEHSVVKAQIWYSDVSVRV